MTAITDQMIETAARAYRHPVGMVTNDAVTRHHDCMRAALEAVAPLIAAQALRDAADAQDADPEFRDPLRLHSDWLRQRADRIEAGRADQ